MRYGQEITALSACQQYGEHLGHHCETQTVETLAPATAVAAVLSRWAVPGGLLHIVGSLVPARAPPVSAPDIF